MSKLWPFNSISKEYRQTIFQNKKIRTSSRLVNVVIMFSTDCHTTRLKRELSAGPPYMGRRLESAKNCTMLSICRHWVKHEYEGQELSKW